MEDDCACSKNRLWWERFYLELCHVIAITKLRETLTNSSLNGKLNCCKLSSKPPTQIINLHAKATEILCALINLEHHTDTFANFGVCEPGWSGFHAGMDPDILHKVWVISKGAQVGFQMLRKWNIGSRIRECMKEITIFVEFLITSVGVHLCIAL